jgi:uncharacterized protein
VGAGILIPMKMEHWQRPTNPGSKLDLELNIEPCLPPLWATSGHAQTVLGHILPSEKLNFKGRRIEVDLPDGDRLVGSVLEGHSSSVVYLFHGLAGSTDSPYMHRSARLAQTQGHTVVMINHRSCGDGARLAKGPYHSGRGEDLGAVIAFGRKHYPKHHHLAVGFSLSGNALLLLLSGKRGNALPDAAISVNAPIDLQSAANLLQTGFNRVYDLKFFIECRRGVLKSRSPDAPKYEIPWLATLTDFDNLYTAPAGGFKNREDYYASCSTANLLSAIQIPTLVLTAADDPFVNKTHYLNAELSNSVAMHIEQYGGHMGYLSRTNTPLGTKRWLDYALFKGIRSLLKSL